MTSIVHVEHGGGDRFRIDMRQHSIVVDQPPSLGGEDSGPTPTELFVASVASCVAFYVGRFLSRHGMDPQGLGVSAEFSLETRPARVGEIRLRLLLPAGVPPERHAALLAVAAHCTVENSLEQRPTVTLEVADRAAAA